MSQLALFDEPVEAEVEVQTLPEGEAVAEPRDVDLLVFEDLLRGEHRPNHPVGFAFACMERAEDAIADAKAAHPERADLLDAAFACLRPRPDVFRRRGHERNVRSHMDELLRRVVEDGEEADLTPATAFECVCAFSHLSLAAPLKHRHHVAAEICFIEAFGEDVARDLWGEEPVRRARMDREQHLVAEVVDQMRHQMRDEDRGKAWKEKLEALS